MPQFLKRLMTSSDKTNSHLMRWLEIGRFAFSRNGHREINIRKTKWGVFFYISSEIWFGRFSIQQGI